MVSVEVAVQPDEVTSVKVNIKLPPSAVGLYFTVEGLPVPVRGVSNAPIVTVPVAVPEAVTDQR